MEITETNHRPVCLRIICWVMTAFMLWSFGTALLAADSLQTDTVEIAGTGWTRELISRIRKEEKEQEWETVFTAWKEKSGAILENRSLDRQAFVSALELDGDSCLVIPEQEQNQLQAEDTKGCLVDWKTAETLFGSQNIRGCKIWYEGRELEVRGILKNVEGVIVVETTDIPLNNSTETGDAGLNEDSGFDRISLKLSLEDEKEQKAEEFLNRHGLEGKVICTEWIQNIGIVISLLLPMALFVKILKEYGEMVLKYRSFPVVFIAGVLGTGLFLWVFGKTQGLRFRIPESMIPTRWSDFTFWQPWLEEKREQYALLTSISKSTFQVEQFRRFLLTVEYGMAAALCMPFSILREKRWTKRTIFFAMGLSWGIFYLLILQYQQAGAALAEKKGRWFLLPIYMLLISLKESLKKRQFFSKNSKSEA